MAININLLPGFFKELILLAMEIIGIQATNYQFFVVLNPFSAPFWLTPNLVALRHSQERRC